MAYVQSSPIAPCEYVPQRNHNIPVRDQNKINSLVSSIELLDIIEASPGSDYISMDPSYITHQRRPALIPQDSELSPEEEMSVRLRTGLVNPNKVDQLYRGNTVSKLDASSTRPASKRKGSILERESNDKQTP